jgi:hypothetical protein
MNSEQGKYIFFNHFLSTSFYSLSGYCAVHIRGWGVNSPRHSTFFQKKKKGADDLPQRKKKIHWPGVRGRFFYI